MLMRSAKVLKTSVDHGHDVFFPLKPGSYLSVQLFQLSIPFPTFIAYVDRVSIHFP